MPKVFNYRRSFTFNGKRYYVRGDTELECIQKMARKLAELERGDTVKDSSAKVRDFALYCFETYRKPKVKEVTYRKYIGRLNRCILDSIGDMRLKDVKRIHCQQCLNALEGQSNYQIRQTIQMLTFIFEQAVIDGMLAKSPAVGIVAPRGTKTQRRSLTEEEEQTFLKVAKSDARFNIFLLSYYCGCRPEEARNIRGGDIVVIEDTPMLHIKGTKTLNADRIVPLDISFYETIKDVKKGNLVAPNVAGNHHNQNSYKRAWDNLCREMNIEMGCKVYRNKLIPPLPLDESLSPYCLRHTYCTNLQKAGVDIRVAQRLMGHSDITLTANIYTHIDTSEIVKVAHILDGGV